MSEAPTNPETGVEAVAVAPTDDDIDTSAFDRMEAPDEDDAEQTPAGDGEGEEGERSEADKAKAAAEADSVEVELDDGSKVRIPKAAEPAFLRHADYTRKTQAHADQVRTFEAERTSFEVQKVESLAALPAEHQKVAVLSHNIAQAKADLVFFTDPNTGVDWEAFRRLAAADPEKQILYDQTRQEYEAARDRLTDLTTEFGTAKNDLATKEDARLKDQATKAAAASAEAWGATEAALADEKTGIPGWSPEKAKDLASIAVKEFGVTVEELQGLHDPRFWKLFNTVASERARADKLQAALNQKTTADNHGKAQTTTPAATVKGSGGQARDPATPRGDDLGTDTWMARRNAQVAKQRTG